MESLNSLDLGCYGYEGRDDEIIELKKHKICYFSELEENLILRIFYNLDIKNLGKIALVCRRFNIIQTNPWLWSQLAKVAKIILIDDSNPLFSYKKQISLSGVIKLKDGYICKHHNSIIIAENTDNENYYRLFREALNYFNPYHYISHQYYGNVFRYLYKDGHQNIQTYYTNFRGNPTSEELCEVHVIEHIYTEIFVYSLKNKAMIERWPYTSKRETTQTL